MSRCFPFPPPGYEGKHRADSLDDLNEAKRKEKKHKKDKKDKKRKDKEKERDRGDGKEKHKKDKDRKSKSKDKKDKHRDDQNNADKESQPYQVNDDSKFVQELDRRIRDGENGKGSVLDKRDQETVPARHVSGVNGKGIQSLEKVPVFARNVSEMNGTGIQSLEKLSVLDKRGQEVTVARNVTGMNGKSLEKVPILNKRNQEMGAARNVSGVNGNGIRSLEKVPVLDKRGQETAVARNVSGVNGKGIQSVLDKRNQETAIARNVSGVNGKGIQSLERVPVLDMRDQEMGIARNASGVSSQQEKNGINRRLDPQGFGNDYAGNSLGAISTCRIGGRPWDEFSGRSFADITQKHREQETKVKSENSRSDPGKSKNDNGVRNDVAADLLKVSNNNSPNGAHIRKRKDMETNGFLHENENRPHKMPKAFPHQSTVNGTFQPPSKPSRDPSTIRVDKKDKPINGVIEPHKPFPLKSNPNQVIGPPTIPPHHNVLDPISEASRKPPHPDSKYLAEVLTVPKMADWSENNEDQDWLFRPSKAMMTRVEDDNDDQQHVWSEAVHIESAGICALPYVIPY